jgi:AcrR family transcriptional regulator
MSESDAPGAGRRRTATARAARKALGSETRQRVLDAAVSLFALNGFDGTAVRDVAREAQVPHTSIAYYFRNKEELWRAAVTQMFDRLHREVGGVPHGSGVEGYRQFLRRYVRYCAAHSEHARLMVHESIRGGARLDWAVEQFMLPGHQAIGPASAERMAAGDLPSIWPWSLAFMVAAMCQAPFLRAAEFKAVTGIDSRSEAVVEAHADAVLAVLLGDGFAGTERTWPESPGFLLPPASGAAPHASADDP